MLLIQFRITDSIGENERLKTIDAVARHLDNLLFTFKQFRRGDFAGLIHVADVATLFCGRLNFRHADILAASVFKRVPPNVRLIDDRAAFKEVFFRPCNGFFGEARNVCHTRRIDREILHRCFFRRRHLTIPKALQFFNAHVTDFLRTLLVRDVLTNGGKVAVGLVRLARQKFARRVINLFVPLGKFINQVRRNALDFKIAARFVFNAISEFHQFARQFVVINIFDKFLRGEHFAILQRLPFLFDGIKRGIEHDAMAVQVRIERA